MMRCAHDHGAARQDNAGSENDSGVLSPPLYGTKGLILLPSNGVSIFSFLSPLKNCTTQIQKKAVMPIEGNSRIKSSAILPFPPFPCLIKHLPILS